MPVKNSKASRTVAGLSDLILRLEDLSPLPARHEMARWLVATQHNVEEAEAMFRASSTWRRQAGVARLVKWRPPAVLRNYYPGGFAGFDREGCPVWIIPFGQADVKGMLACVSKEEFMDFTLKIVECSMLLMKKKSQMSGKAVSQHVFIFDLDGFSLKAATHGPTIEILQKLISVYEANYPETLKAAYVLNASSFFQLVFKIVQSAVQQKTLSKIQVFGADGWKEALLSVLPAGILPAQWGGDRIENHQHQMQICLGGEVSQDYQSQYQPQEITDMGDICTVKIGPGSLITQKYKVEKDCDLRWKFKSEGGDLGFGIQSKISEKASDGVSAEEDSSGCVIAITRVSSQTDVQTGVLACQAGYTYVLTFDNTYSRFKAKTVMYSVIMETSDIERSCEKLTVDDLVKSVREGLGPQEDINEKKIQTPKKQNHIKKFSLKKKSSG